MIRAAVFFTVVIVSLTWVARYGSAAEGELGDIAFARKSAGADEIPPAVFPHWVHRMQFKCFVCHDAIFQMRAGAAPITKDAIREGKFCGVCHNGNVAFPVGFETCDRCHYQ